MKKETVWDRLRRNQKVVDLCEETVRERYPDPGAPDTNVRIPQVVIRRPRPSHQRPPLGAMTSVGRGGSDVLVRLYLWLFLLATDQPQGYRKGPTRWAKLLNLVAKEEWEEKEACRRAGRRVTKAVQWLRDPARRLVTNPSRRLVGLLDPRTHKPYRKEADEQLRARMHRRDEHEKKYGIESLRNSVGHWEGPPLDLPVSWWFNGTISALKGVELACLLIMWDRTRGAITRFRVPRVRKTQYGVFKGCWQRGCDGLESLRFLKRHEVKTSGSSIDYEYEVAWSRVSARRERRVPDRTRVYDET